MLKKKIELYKLLYLLSIMLFSIIAFTSCEIIGDIFEAGVWTGIIIVALIVGLLIYVFSKFRRRN